MTRLASIRYNLGDFSTEFNHALGGSHYTLVDSCGDVGPTPLIYLEDLFARLPPAKITEIKAFTPAAWAKAKAKVKLFAQAA
jgi:hypothetical protein